MAQHYSQRDAAATARIGEQLRRFDPKQKVLIRGATIVSMDPVVGDFLTGDVLIEGDTIAAVGATVDAADAIVIEAGGMIVMPGLVDTHRHCWQNSLRHLIPDVDLAEYIAFTHIAVAPHVRPEDMYAGGLVSMYGAIDSGMTCVLDLCHNSRSKAHSDAMFASFADAGIRAVHASAPPNTGEWEGQWPDDLTRLRDVKCAESGGLTTLRMAIDMHRIKPVEELIALARALGLGINIDGVFGPAASAEIVSLARQRLLGDDIAFIHCTSLTEDAWRGLADAGCGITLAPTSDAQIGLGDAVPPVQKALDYGLRPALSIDVEITLANDLFSQMRCLFSTQRMFVTKRRYEGESDVPDLITTRDVLDFATVQGARVNGLQGVVGSLTPGQQADLVMIRADDPNNLPLNNALGTIVLGTDTKNVDAVFIGGRLRKWDGAIVGVDMDRLRELAYASREYLTDKAGIDVPVIAPATIRGGGLNEELKQFLDSRQSA